MDVPISAEQAVALGKLLLVLMFSVRGSLSAIAGNQVPSLTRQERLYLPAQG